MHASTRQTSAKGSALLRCRVEKGAHQVRVTLAAAGLRGEDAVASAEDVLRGQPLCKRAMSGVG